MFGFIESFGLSLSTGLGGGLGLCVSGFATGAAGFSTGFCSGLGAAASAGLGAVAAFEAGVALASGFAAGFGAAVNSRLGSVLGVSLGAGLGVGLGTGFGAAAATGRTFGMGAASPVRSPRVMPERLSCLSGFAFGSLIACTALILKRRTMLRKTSDWLDNSCDDEACSSAVALADAVTFDILLICVPSFVISLTCSLELLETSPISDDMLWILLTIFCKNSSVFRAIILPSPILATVASIISVVSLAACSLRVKVSHFLGNHGKTLAVYPRAGGFHRGVKRKKICLECYIVDNLYYL